MTQPAPSLRPRAEGLASPLPPLLVRAEKLAQTLWLGGHGRRQAGQGDAFWQYRPAQAGDAARAIDWRRSGRADGHFVREKEWLAPQSVHLWVDASAAMGFASERKLTSKHDRAALVAMALTILLLKGGERVALTSLGTPPSSGERQLHHIADALTQDPEAEFSPPDLSHISPHARALFISDFLAPFATMEAAVKQATERGVSGVLYQILDPAEAHFPYRGRTVFTSMTGHMRHETLRASDLRGRYLDRLAERQDQLAELARQTGWRFASHTTTEPAQPALLWLYQAMEGGC